MEECRRPLKRLASVIRSVFSNPATKAKMYIYVDETLETIESPRLMRASSVLGVILQNQDEVWNEWPMAARIVRRKGINNNNIMLMG